MDVDAYAKRWGVETGFRQVRNTRIKTRSRNRVARHPVFTLSMAPYDCRVFGCTMLAWTNLRTDPSEPVMVLYAMVGALPDVHLRGPSKPWPPDPGWPLT